MHRISIRQLAVAAALLLALSASSFAGKYNKALNIGQKAPAWNGLIGVDGKRYSLSDHKKVNGVAVVFTCNSCPVAVNYEDRLIQFAKDYKAKGIDVVAINVSNRPPDRLDKMKVRAQEKKFNFLYLYDPTQKTARAYGATCTPHVFLLNQKREIAYMGAIDDNQTATRVKKHYLREAADAILLETETKQFGCSIKYEKVTASAN